MFGGDWNESEALEVYFPDEDVAAMLTVLNIAHLKFEDVPGFNGLAFEELVNLAVLCDKYDVVHLVHPFLEWYDWARHYVYPEYVGPGYPAWLFIAWTFGYRHSFGLLARHLSLRVEVRDNIILLGNGYDVMASYMPQDILESILEVRKNTIAEMLKTCYDLVELALEGPVCQLKHTDRPATEKSNCSSIILGSVLGQIKKLDLYPHPKGTQTIGSCVLDVMEHLGTVNPTPIYADDIEKAIKVASDHRRHSFGNALDLKEVLTSSERPHHLCTLSYIRYKEIGDIVHAMPSLVLSHHINHMNEQAKK
ncbi:hypothetical protein DM02DRAFT_682783 [Periconia macrospinosa]|uniref:BTB domain-containing protein n=1 Tax=Periconia macrospinosa TaxID=97972 RepID=A0A2V1E954_9PLEO|nr:hypothetical protein DM02DRAFT_682783 [Periconia macrospinosa]